MLLKQHTVFRVFTNQKLYEELMADTTQHFTDTIFYQIELTARYVKLLGVQLFGKLGIGLTPEEFSALDTIQAHDSLCQRDLAKLILKDRANTGKLLDSLEAKGYVERELSVKNNRPVKIVRITELGQELYYTVHEKLIPHHKVVKERIANTDLEKLGELLKDLRDVLEDTIDIDI